jgi:multiple antibiotic resistance protein
VLLQHAFSIFLFVLRETHDVDFWRSLEHGAYCWGIILLRIGFELFSPSQSGASSLAGGSTQGSEDVAFVPLAMPIMFGPGAIATILGMVSLVKDSEFGLVSAVAICLAIIATMFVTYLFLASAKKVLSRIGSKGIDAASRIVGFFVSTMGMGLIFHGVVEAIQTYGTTAR